MDEESYYPSSEYTSSSLEEAESSVSQGSDDEYMRYLCRDGVTIDVCRKVARKGLQTAYNNAIAYARDKNADALRERLFISGAQFSRDMKEVLGSLDVIRTIILPPMVRTVKQGAFYRSTVLRSAVLNEGLEVLGTDWHNANGSMNSGVFEASGVRKIRLPSTLKRIEYSAFELSLNLRNIVLPDKLEYIGTRCFY